VSKTARTGPAPGRRRSVIDCDDPATRSAVRDDPARFIESDQLVLIDENQHAPALLDAIKAQLNRDLRSGRYILAESTQYVTVPEGGQALTGRVDIIPVFPPSQGEIDGVRDTFLARLLDGAGSMRFHRGCQPPRRVRPALDVWGCPCPFAARRAVPRPAGSPTAASTRMPWTSPGCCSARCCPGFSASSPPDLARS
jgi:AAA domain